MKNPQKKRIGIKKGPPSARKLIKSKPDMPFTVITDK